MEWTNRGFWRNSKISETKVRKFNRRWSRLCERYLPIRYDDSIWRYNRESKPHEPLQGWKLHLSATILEACDLFEKVAPLLSSHEVQFKAPVSLHELSKINCGLHYGYSQIGKFITIYPPTVKKSLELAKELHQLTQEFSSILVPFDERYKPNSSVFYRYGAFEQIEFIDKDGIKLPAIKNLAGELVLDDRFQAVPDWIENPFKKISRSKAGVPKMKESPLSSRYRVFRAITQRGKGGTYRAFDVSVTPLRPCIVKEGRRNGEIHWNRQDGYYLVKNEFSVLTALGKKVSGLPKVYSSFETEGNFYLVMEFVPGNSLLGLMKRRRRRFSVKQALQFAIKISSILTEIHQAGWIWNDCKPANLIVTPEKTLRPIDFENSYKRTKSAPFDWNTRGFSKPKNPSSIPEESDLFALGAVIYFLLTGKLFDIKSPIPIKKLRRGVPTKVQEIVENLLCTTNSGLKMKSFEIHQELKKILISDYC